MLRVFVSHPLSDNVPVRRAQNRELMNTLNKEFPNVIFISPLLLFDYMDDDSKRDDILAICRLLIRHVCDEVWIFGDSSGCRMERDCAEDAGKEIKYFKPEREKGK